MGMIPACPSGPSAPHEGCYIVKWQTAIHANLQSCHHVPANLIGILNPVCYRLLPAAPMRRKIPAIAATIKRDKKAGSSASPRQI
jgi:hypothetical protein